MLASYIPCGNKDLFEMYVHAEEKSWRSLKFGFWIDRMAILKQMIDDGGVD